MTVNPPYLRPNPDNSLPCVIIIGGTSGIGLALALAHLKLRWQVIVVGSNPDKIAQLNQQQPELTTIQCDITQIEQRNALFIRLAQQPFKRLIYSAGWYLNERVFTLEKFASARMLGVNLQAFHAVFDWASQQLITHKSPSQTGTYNDNKHNEAKRYDNDPALVCLSSIAGVLDYPYASLYAKCKRAMIVGADAYRLALAPFNIQVTCIASGYIDTQALRNLNEGDASHKPFIVAEEVAVRCILKAIEENEALAIFPASMRYLTYGLNKLPTPLLNFLMQRQLDKKSEK